LAVLAVLALPIGLVSVSCSRPPYQVGFIGPMTGSSANVGVEGYKGFTMAVAEANAAGGIRGSVLDVLVLDDKADPGACLAAARELVAKGVQVLVLHTTSAAAAGAIPWLQQQDVVVVSRTVSDPAWSGIVDNILRFVGTPVIFGLSLGRFAVTRGCTSVALIIDERNAGYAGTMSGGFISAVGDMPVLGERVINAGWSHDEAVRWAVELGAHSIFAVLSGLDAARLAQSLERHGFDGDLYLSPWSQDQNLLSYAGRFADRIFLTSPFNPDDPAARYQDFRTRYRRLYGDDPVMSGAFGYEMADFVVQGFKLAADRSPGAVKHILLRPAGFEGLQQVIALDANGDATMAATVIGIRDGTFVAMGR
jgi:branched-chain amino acid transport system substrate-binding protein